MKKYNPPAPAHLYEDTIPSIESEQEDEAIEKYIEERRLEFYEEWFQYLDEFYK